MLMRGPATSVRTGDTSRSTPEPSSSQASRRRVWADTAGEAVTATASARNRRIASVTEVNVPTTGTSPPGTRPVGSPASGTHAPTTCRPECVARRTWRTNPAMWCRSPIASTRRVLAIGDRHHIVELVHHVRRATHSGLHVVGACVPDAGEPTVRVPGGDVPVVGTLTLVTDAIRRLRADAVAVTASPAVSAQTLRRLAWELEGVGVDLLVSPVLTDVAGPRISIQPVAGLPLLHVNEPEFTGGRKLLKSAVDRTCAVGALLLLAPLLVLIGVLIRLDSPGPALFRQRRVGQDGRVFTCYKFRSMRRTAEADRALLLDLNERSEGLLFKIRDDPRITRVGRWLRKYSIDEFPQLWNIVKGDMSVVGPRPPLPSEAENYGYDVRRRLLVKPGLTGLWQISGRSDLPWDEAVRLDLYYVENWSPALDVLIVWKTAFAVLRCSGAY